MEANMESISRYSWRRSTSRTLIIWYNAIRVMYVTSTQSGFGRGFLLLLVRDYLLRALVVNG
ncbi:hypothetical protein BDV40DRAFT_258421 [Aspergillus tamarii]|uniref:Uncharacterized protein n=1 Tax=Aspergillus tamarii TaxID=41984 RepID=A0A5N6V3E7_ASPTM|nr:hypothetical protein BDV40DRAFT_258421 [Aspergillus tamarii]